ncbi:hypothetical protein ACFXKI_34780 [Streptomyces mirabilis]|uniref:hypothetical protein n=1 Tax=Streptomyces mirabilis TaxID=68239 RepID=UPI00367E9228
MDPGPSQRPAAVAGRRHPLRRLRLAALGPSHPPLLAELDRAELLNRLRTRTPSEAASHTALALLDDPHFLGDPAVFLTELAAADGGTAAVSRLLELLAHHTARAANAPVITAAVELWRAALTADLCAGALAGAGTFALATSIDDTVWLELTLACARHTPALRDTDHIAERSAHHPDNPAAAQLTALLVAHPSTDPWRDATVRQHARTLWPRAANTHQTRNSPSPHSNCATP